MSRIERTRVDSGDTTNAAELNNTYSDYSQSAALDAPNTRDQAFDISHFTNTPIVLNSTTATLGNTGLHISAGTTTVASTTSTGSIVNDPLQTSAGAETRIDLSGSPWVFVAGDVLRVWWSLSVKPTFSGSPPFGAAKGLYTVDKLGGGTQVITDGFHCWLMYLEWDITSGALSAFVPVSGQTAFDQTIGSDTGGYITSAPATSVISPWVVFSPGTAPLGKPADAGTGKSHGWFASVGMWAHPATGALTVYGLRLRITGILHPAHLSTGDEENILIYDTGVGGVTQTLVYKGGRLSALQMRGS